MNRFTATNDTSDADILTLQDAENDLAEGLTEGVLLPSHDEFDEQVAKAQEQLDELRRQQEEIERQKTELEHLRVRQAEFQRGRVEMLENLQHALDVLDRYAFEAEQRLEQYGRAKESFTKHLDVISNLRPESWSNTDIKTELEHASQHIEEAREEYSLMLTHLEAFVPEGQPMLPPAPAPLINPEEATTEVQDAELVTTPALSGGHGSFGYWLRSGLAFTLPMITFGAVALMLMLLFG